MLAVRHGRCRGKTPFEVVPLMWHRLVDRLAPALFTGDPVKADDRKSLWFPRMNRFGMFANIWRAGWDDFRNGHGFVERDGS